jgi:hypothetical protein
VQLLAHRYAACRGLRCQDDDGRKCRLAVALGSYGFSAVATMRRDPSTGFAYLRMTGQGRDFETSHPGGSREQGGREAMARRDARVGTWRPLVGSPGLTLGAALCRSSATIRHVARGAGRLTILADRAPLCLMPLFGIVGGGSRRAGEPSGDEAGVRAVRRGTRSPVLVTEIPRLRSQARYARDDRRLWRARYARDDRRLWRAR